MKKRYYNLYKDYLVYLFIFLVITNYILSGLIVKGIIYYSLMFIIIFINLYLLIKHKKDIVFEDGMYFLFLVSPFFSKNIFYLIISISTMVLIIIYNLEKSNLIKITSYITILIILISLPIISFAVIINDSKIYSNTHYYCGNEYEIYVYSAGAFDSYHYNINKNIQVLNVSDMLEIVYNKSVGDTLDEYNKVLNNYECKLVGEE